MEYRVRSGNGAFDTDREMGLRTILGLLAIFSIYLALRGLAWHRTFLLDDTDSVTYLSNIKLFLSLSLEKIWAMDPDSTPFYPFFGALFSIPGWTVETGARLCSLFFSGLLFFALAGIGRKIASDAEVFLGLLVLSFNPELITLSFSVLTEPSYIAVVYIGFGLFWAVHRNPKSWHAVVLGLIFGLSFLNRLEGLLYVAIIPFLLLSALFFLKDREYGLKKISGWILLYVLCFSIVAAPQIWRVSQKMGKLSLNGRQVWSSVLKYPDGKSEVEKIFGLDYSPSTNNIKYLKEHPEQLKQFDIAPRPIDYIKLVVRNFNNFYKRGLGILIGPLSLIFFGLGMVVIWQRGLRFEAFLIVSFICLNLAAPFLHNVVIRHIAVIAPMMLLVAGIGIMHAARVLVEDDPQHRFKVFVLAMIFLISTIGAFVVPLKAVFHPPQSNTDYSLEELEEPLNIIREIEANELNRPPNITAQRKYISYFAGGNHFYVPYATIEKFIAYCCLNDIDFVYLKHARVKKYPFFDSFSDENDRPAGFDLIYTGQDSRGGKIELFRFDKGICLQNQSSGTESP